MGERPESKWEQEGRKMACGHMDYGKAMRPVQCVCQWRRIQRREAKREAMAAQQVLRLDGKL